MNVLTLLYREQGREQGSFWIPKVKTLFEPDLMYTSFKTFQLKFQSKGGYGSCLSLKILPSFNLKFNTSDLKNP